MRQLQIILVVTVLATSAVVESKAAKPSPIGYGNNVGIGLYLGQPSGLAVQYWLSPGLAASGIFGAWLHPAQGGTLGARLSYVVRDLTPEVQPLEVCLYFGGGVGFGWLNITESHRHEEPWPHRHTHEYSKPFIYIQPVAGGQLLFRSVPVDIFLELSPSLRFSPSPTRMDFAGGFGARYHF